MTLSPGARRIVSLVPSLTESLFALGLGDRVVGVTDYCLHPEEGLRGLPRLGGTKNPDLGAIRALRPDLVIANREENTERSVRELRRAGIAVHVTDVRSVRGALATLGELCALGVSDEARARVLGPLERAVARAEARQHPSPPRFFCPIWRDPWMVVGADTYASDLLTLAGGRNAFAGRRDRRYPVVTLGEVMEAAPDVVVLPDEPYPFADTDAAEFAALDLPAARHHRIHRVDGTLLTWYGPRLAAALETFRQLFAPKPLR